MKFEETLSKLRPKTKLVLELDGKPVVDERLASLLKMIDETGSILSASKALGIVYSRAWEAIFKAESILGTDLIERRPGRTRKSARLTDEGRKILQLYFSHTSLTLPRAKEESPRLVYAGSHDPLLSTLFGFLKFDKEVHWIGSLVGLLSLSVGDADVAGIHLYDPMTKGYNIPYIERLGLEGYVRLFPGYMREIGIALHPSVKFEGLDDLFRPEIRWINRNPGSGTRLLFEELIEKRSKALRISPSRLRKRIQGYDTCVNTHQEVAEAIASGKAEAGITIKSMAEIYGLKFIHLQWEKFDFAVSLRSIEEEPVKQFLRLLKKELKGMIKRFPGYRL